ncbi:hypothetical protein GYMLUDRAFT_38505 [Collybiopsis luxurians FD-317 M1]|nr:hypothetical protein GYMLUDRAFT_38505 [Collybiopsis luxurians FD-317 M1]
MSSLNSSCLSPDAISTYSDIRDLQPVQRFRLAVENDYRCPIKTLDYWWGFQRGQIHLFSELNLVSVRADVANLLWRKDVALVPAPSLLQKMLEFMKGQFFIDIDCRRSCFEILPLQEYEYKLLPLNESGPPIFVLDSKRTHLQRIEFPYTNLPPLKLDLYPFFSVIHAGAGFIDKWFTRYPIYSQPIRATYCLCLTSVPPEFEETPIVPPLRNRQPEIDEYESSSELGDTLYDPEEDARKIHSWIQEADAGLSGDSLPLNVSKMDV